jgi:flagellin|nr:flagellin [uncultured Schaedlerella sp.]
MVVQHNITAMNSNRMLGLTTAAQAKSTEKLSSGYKINRAADDAAGLSISEKMRRQIRGLTQASANAQDGISCVQTAEGALNEVQDMLQRMNELAVKGENGTLTSADRSYIQAEVKQLMSEIDRVQSTTTFNEQSLLDGSFSNKGLQVGAESGQHIGITISNMSTNELIAKAVNDKVTFGVANIDSTEEGTGVATGDLSLAGATDSKKYVEGDNYLTLDMLQKFYAFEKSDVVDTALTGAGTVKVTTTSTTLDTTNAPTAADFAALNAFAKHAIKDVSQQRSDLGAIQNRLEHTISNLDNIVENTTSAEAQIRDTDIATEMVRYANNNILQQAGTSMLSQANQSNQLALSLLG